jgi:hypothetical protein
MLVLLLSGITLLALPLRVCAQDDSETPLGDVARSFRKKPAPSETVVDNDNLSKVVDDAETRRLTGASPVFSLDPWTKSFYGSSPDVTCSLSFSAKASSLLSDPILLDELPRTELAKLDGPAIIDGDSLQISMHNGTSWDLREVVIGLTIVKRPEARAPSSFSQARMVPAVVGGVLQQAQDSFQKQPDVTLLLRVKGSAPPAATALFRTSLNFALFPDQDWHWAIVRAKGIPPQPSPDPMLTQPDQSGGPLPTAPPAAGPQISPSIQSPPNPDVATH